jgi:hypothetical protein
VAPRPAQPDAPPAAPHARIDNERERKPGWSRRQDRVGARAARLHERPPPVRWSRGPGLYRNPRATTDIDLNVTVSPEDADPVLGALTHLGVTVSPSDRAAIERDGQARLDWDGSYLDLFFATIDLHLQMAERSRRVDFGPVRIPILSPEHLIVCKVVFDRPKDWLDVEEMIAWGTAIDDAEVLGWIERILGATSEQYARLAALLEREPK